MDTSSGPFSEQFYPYNLDLDYGRCDYNVGQAFKIFGVWQPVFFHNSESWLHHIVDGWSLSGIFNIHSGFPWNPVVSFFGQGSLYCQQCGYSQVLPIDYLGGARGSTSIDAFKTVAQSNFPNGGAAYFAAQQCTAVITTDCYPVFNVSGSSGTAVPTMPAFRRNSLNLPGYKDVDLTLAKAFGFPKAPVLGENAKIELRLDAYNLFNNLNLNPNSIQRDINSGNFGTITSALAARVVTLGIRFSF